MASSRHRYSLQDARHPDLAQLTPHQKEVLVELKMIAMTVDSVNANLSRACDLLSRSSAPSPAPPTRPLPFASDRDSSGDDGRARKAAAGKTTLTDEQVHALASAKVWQRALAEQLGQDDERPAGAAAEGRSGE